MKTSLSPSDDDLFEEATYWFLYRRDSTDPATEADYQDWLAGNPDREAAIEEVTALFGSLEEPVAAVANADFAQHIPVPIKRPWRNYVVAASLLMAVMAGAWFTQGGHYYLQPDVNITQTGEVRNVTLADGSTVTLGTDTVMKVQFREGERRVRLERGEAFFQVTPDRSRPFVVNTTTGSVRVLGTGFDVRRFDDRTRVSVTEGVVQVNAFTHKTQNIRNQDTLTAGQSAWLSGAGVQRDGQLDPLEVSAWRHKKLIFFKTPLSEVIAEIDRYHQGIIIVQGQTTRQIPISGAFDVSDPNESLRKLAVTLNLRHAGIGDKLVILY
ncbi:MAG: FecR family protein [Asticcacaulis sp.]